MKNVVVLSGGGMKCAYQVGALKGLKYKDITIDCIIGTSGGALNASLIAQNKLEDLELIWEYISKNGLDSLFDSNLIDLKTKKIKWFKLISKILPLSPFSKRGKNFVERLQDNLQNINELANSAKLVKLLLTYVNKDKVKIPFYFNTVDLNTGKELILSHKDFTSSADLAIGIAASASIPVLLNPLTINTISGRYLNCVDGGIASNVLLHQAIRFIKEQKNPLEWNIIVINANTNKPNEKSIKGITNIISRVFIDIMLTKLSTKEFQIADSYNKLISNFVVGNSKETYYNIPIQHIQPKESLGGTLDISEDIYSKTYIQGYKDTIKFFK